MVQLSILVDICSFGIQVGEFADKRRVAVVSCFFESCGFYLTDNANLVAGSDKSFGMYGKAMNWDTGRSEPVEMGL